MSEYRVEKDSMGEIRVPSKAYYGAQTQRAVENFPVSRLRFPRRFIEALGLIKACAAETNRELGEIDARTADAVREGAEEVRQGKLADQFVVDIFQTGSGTSTLPYFFNSIISNAEFEEKRAKYLDEDKVTIREGQFLPPVNPLFLQCHLRLIH